MAIISGNLCPKLDVQDFEKEEGLLILPALLVVTGSLWIDFPSQVTRLT